jgi:putative DNA primase/helicase
MVRQNSVTSVTSVTHLRMKAPGEASSSATRPSREASPTPLEASPKRGTVDLRTGERIDTDGTFLSARWTPVIYDPDATCPRWDRFVSEIMQGDTEMVAFLQRLAGYAATGSSTEQVMPIFEGTGSNGKGVFLRTLNNVLGE